VFDTQLWLVVEQRDLFWNRDVEANKLFFTELSSAAKSIFGTKIGVYTDKDRWTDVFGSEWLGGADLPLWWRHWKGGDPSFDDFEPFAGWKAPAIKQYSRFGRFCNMDTNLDCY